MSRIAAVRAFEALDSRGRPTVAARVTLANGRSARVVVPSGASTGGYEARERRDGGGRHGGWGVRHAVTAVNGTLAAAIHGMDPHDQRAVDMRLEEADGTPDLRALGANAVLAVSLAVMRARAEDRGIPLWQVLREEGPASAATGQELVDPPRLPKPMVNILSGGAHAGRLLDIQDVLAMPVGAQSVAEAIEWAARVRQAAAEAIAEAGGPAALVADEGGLAHRFATNEAAVALVRDAIERAGLRPGEDVAIAIDLAANQFWNSAGYELSAEGRAMSSEQWANEIERWTREYPIASVEDPFAEDDWSGWLRLTPAIARRCEVIGDDLFATNAGRLAEGVRSGAATAVLIKPNQAGTVSRAQDVLRAAKAAGYRTVVSARSGDTEDDWLADLAVGWDADRIKVGSTTRSERTAKWNRLLEIEDSVLNTNGGCQ